MNYKPRFSRRRRSYKPLGLEGEELSEKATSRLAVVVASLGRPDELAQLSTSLMKQTVRPDSVVFSVTDESDIPNRDELYPNSEVIFGEKGLCAQRNRGMAHCLANHDIVVFLDDDYLAVRTAIEGIIAFFEERDEFAGATGYVIADGITSGGIEYDRALDLVRAYEEQTQGIKTSVRRRVQSLYGCNMAFRTSAIQDARFDENLPLYGWQEDVDFSARVGRQGFLAKTAAFAGVHRGVTRGRTSGVRLGYSQIINPLYLVRKGSMPFFVAFKLIIKNVLANHVKMLRAEPWVDRKGRVKGNWLALKDLIFGTLEPMKMLEIKG